MTRSAARSRRSGSGAGELPGDRGRGATSITESRPNPISATEEAIVPAAIATTASITL